MNFVYYIILGVLGVVVLSNLFNKIMHMNLVKVNHKLLDFFTKDISQEAAVHGPRVFTVWNLSHILYFAVGAYLFPDKALLLWSLGLVWELLEYYVNVMNPLDILWNTIGIALGLALRKVKL
jgi:hypothetical protein